MANYREDIVNIELSSGTVARSELNHTLGGGDYAADRFGVRAYRNSSPENLTGTISGYFIRADGYTVPIASGSVSGNKAYITLPAACYEVEGKFTLSIKLTGNGVNGTVRIVDGTVMRTSTAAAASTTLIPSVESLVEDIAEAVATIPAEYSDLWTKLAPAFSADTEYLKGQYVTYNENVYRFKVDHTGAWTNDDVVNVNIGDELTYANKAGKSAADVIYKYGTKNAATIRLSGEIVPYRYRQTTVLESQTSIRYRLPQNVKSVSISMAALQNLNSYTFLDENDNVLFYKLETEDGDVTYTDLNAFEAAYLVCSNSNSLFNNITVDAVVAGVGAYIDEARNTSETKYTLLQGVLSDVSFYDFTQSTGNYTLVYDTDGFDAVEITSFNTAVTNKYTFLDGNGDIVGYFRPSAESEIGATTTVKAFVPANAESLYVHTYRAERPNVLVYGIKMPDSYEWTTLGGEFVDYRYSGSTRSERENGSKEFAASDFDILRLADGTPTANVNVFTAFDDNYNVLGYISLHDYDITPETFFICPRGTTKVAVAGAAFASGGWDTCTPMTIQKLKTAKRLSVLGDSITTFQNFSPDDYNPFYASGRDGLPNASYSWWGIVAREKRWALSSINGYGGSQVADTAGRTDIPMCSTTRTSGLADKGTPDVIIILGGTNDFGHGVPIGTWAGMDDLPTTGEDFRKAYALMLNRIHASYPLAMVYCCTLPNRERDEVPGSLEKYHDQYLHQFNDAIRQIAPMLNCRVIDLESCGINQYNMETYMSDYHEDTGIATHPNIAGHALIAQRILNSLI